MVLCACNREITDKNQNVNRKRCERLEKLQITLAAARVNAGMTQEDVAREMHVSKNTVLNWEKGKVIPNFATLSTLSSLYKIPADNIFLPNKST